VVKRGRRIRRRAQVDERDRVRGRDLVGGRLERVQRGLGAARGDGVEHRRVPRRQHRRSVGRRARQRLERDGQRARRSENEANHARGLNEERAQFARIEHATDFTTSEDVDSEKVQNSSKPTGRRSASPAILRLNANANGERVFAFVASMSRRCATGK